MQLFTIGLISATAVAIIAPVFQQTPQANPLLPEGMPPTLTAQAWTPDYKAIRLSISGAQGTYMGMDLSTVIMMSSFSGSNGRSAGLLTELGARWTKGETVQIAGQIYYVTYKPEMSGLNLIAGMMNSGQPQAVSVALQLDLVRTDMMSEIEPLSGLTKDKFLSDIKSAGWTFSDTADVVPIQGDRVGADRMVGLSNIKQVGLATLMYENDYDDLLPYPQSTDQVKRVTYPYIKTTTVWDTHNPAGSRFLFNMCLGGVSSTEIPEPAATPVFYEDKPWADGKRLVAFADGHAKTVDASEWADMQKYLHLTLKRNAKPFPPNYSPPIPPSGNPDGSAPAETAPAPTSGGGKP